MLRKVMFVLGLSVATSGFASSMDNAQITQMMIDRSYSDYIFVQANGKTVGKGGSHCSTNTRWNYVLRTNDQFGKQMHSQLMMAFAAGKKVKLEGKNTCPVGVTEELKRITVYK